MKTRNLTAIMLRVAALYFLYITIVRLISTYDLLVSGNFASANVSLPVIITSNLLPLLGFVILWLFPNSIAQLIVKPSNNETIQPMPSNEWLRIVVISMGLYLTVFAVLDASYWLASYLLMHEHDGAIFMAEQKAAIITTGLEFITGLLLINKNAWISQHLLNFNAPEPKTTDSET